MTQEVARQNPLDKPVFNAMSVHTKRDALAQRVASLASELHAQPVGNDTFRLARGQHTIEFQVCDERNRLALLVCVRSRPQRYKTEAPTHRTPEPPMITFRYEHGLHRLGKRLGLNREHQSGDPRFDDAVYMDDNGLPPAYIQALLGQPRVTGHIMAIMETTQQSFTILDEGPDLMCSLRLNPSDQPHLLETAVMSSLLDHLLALLEAMPLAQPDHASRRVSPLIGILVTGFVAFVIHMPAMSWTINRNQLLDRSYLYAVPLVVLALLTLLGAIAWGLRRRADTLQAVLLAALIYTPLTPLVAGVWLNGINSALDSSEARVVEARVVERGAKRSSGKSGASIHYSVTLELGEPTGEVHLDVKRAVFERLPAAGERLTVRVYQGALGWAWVRLEQDVSRDR